VWLRFEQRRKGVTIAGAECVSSSVQPGEDGSLVRTIGSCGGAIFSARRLTPGRECKGHNEDWDRHEHHDPIHAQAPSKRGIKLSPLGRIRPAANARPRLASSAGHHAPAHQTVHLAAGSEPLGAVGPAPAQRERRDRVGGRARQDVARASPSWIRRGGAPVGAPALLELTPRTRAEPHSGAASGCASSLAAITMRRREAVPIRSRPASPCECPHRGAGKRRGQRRVCVRARPSMRGLSGASSSCAPGPSCSWCGRHPCRRPGRRRRPARRRPGLPRRPSAPAAPRGPCRAWPSCP